MSMLVPYRAYLIMICLIGLPIYGAQAQARPSQKAKPKKDQPVRTGRETMLLADTWRFLADSSDQGERAQWEKAVPEGTGKIEIMSRWPIQPPPGSAGIVWFWRAFTPPASWQGQTVRVRFEAAAETARVWLNGQLLGEHSGGATPFEFDVTTNLHPGADNLLALRLMGDGKPDGLWQGVKLLAHDEAYLVDCFPQTDAFGHLTAAITLRNSSSKSGDATLDARVVAADAPTRDVKRTYQNLHLTPGDNQTNLLLTVSGKTLGQWSPQAPKLYLLQLSFRQDRDILDTQETTFGFRELGVQGDALTINGAAIKPTVMLRELAQQIVTAGDEEHARTLLRGGKSTGINLMYLEAPAPALLSLADQEGMMVIEGPRHGQTPPARDAELHALVLRDRAHPCIIGWNASEATDGGMQALRRLDPTRLLLSGPRAAPEVWPPGQDAPGKVPDGLTP
jgi:beta-galactosidase/beta-glucuronidase